MVHNGIEYGDMQLICEAYHVMKGALGMTNDEMSTVWFFFTIILPWYQLVIFLKLSMIFSGLKMLLSQFIFLDKMFKRK